MGRNIIETIMGAVVLVVAGGFLIFAFEKTGIDEVDGYSISASFSDISGITLGSDVRIGGMKVGVVEDMSLDGETYQASLTLQISDDIELPKDSSAAVASTGLLGDKFIKVEPGGDDNMLEDGEAIRFTQSSVSFEELIGKFVFSGGGVGSDSADGTAAGEEEPEEEDDNPFSLGL